MNLEGENKSLWLSLINPVKRESEGQGRIRADPAPLAGARSSTTRPLLVEMGCHLGPRPGDQARVSCATMPRNCYSPLPVTVGGGDIPHAYRS